jgi:predicted TIM-barrel fold metal-dependent hydrolase
MIIDTHTHVVNSDRIKHPLHPDARGWSLEVSNNVEDLIIEMDNAGVAGATLVQPASTYGLDNSYQCDSANQFSPRTVAVGILNPATADAAEKLSYWVNERGMQGVRLLTEAEPDDPACDPLWTRAEELQIPISIGGGGTPQKVERITIMTARHPKAIVAPDHFAGWSSSEDKLAMTIALENLAALPNAYLRISSTSLSPYSDLSDTEQELFQRVIQAFTPPRVMWGSNFPSSRDGGYIGQVQLGKSALSWLGENDINWIMGKTAAQIWPILKG